MEKLGDILRYTKPTRTFAAALICQRAQEIIGDAGRVVSFRNGTIKIQLTDSFRANQLAQNNLELIGRINQRIGRPIVNRLKIEVTG